MLNLFRQRLSLNQQKAIIQFTYNKDKTLKGGYNAENFKFFTQSV